MGGGVGAPSVGIGHITVAEYAGHQSEGVEGTAAE